MKKKKLEADISFDFALIGLITTLKEYKLAWHLNAALGIQLAKDRDIEMEFEKTQKIVISNYFHETEHSYIRMLKNKSISVFDEKPAFMIPELNNFDYLILARGFEDRMTLAKLKDTIAAIPKMQYVQIFDTDTLKSKENLIF
jgi:hypothetical protein